MADPEEVQKGMRDAARLEKEARARGDRELERVAGDLKRKLTAEHNRLSRELGGDRKRTWPW